MLPLTLVFLLVGVEVVGALLPNLAKSSEKFWLLLLAGLGEGAGGGSRVSFCRFFLRRFSILDVGAVLPFHQFS